MLSAAHFQLWVLCVCGWNETNATGMLTPFLWTEIGRLFVSRSPLVVSEDEPAGRPAAPYRRLPIVRPVAAKGTACDLTVARLAWGWSDGLGDAVYTEWVSVAVPTHLATVAAGPGAALWADCGDEWISLSGWTCGVDRGVPQPFPVQWTLCDLSRCVERCRARLVRLHRRRSGAADTDADDAEEEIRWLRWILFRIGCALRRHGDEPLALDCFDPGSESRRRPALMPEVVRRLARQGDALCVQVARGGWAGTESRGDTAAVVVRLRGSTVAARYRTLAQRALTAVADLGEATTGAGFDACIGRLEPRSVLASGGRVRMVLMSAAKKNNEGTDGLPSFLADLADRAEFELRRRFAAAETVWGAALAMRDLHCALTLCIRQVDVHAARTTGVSGSGPSAEEWIECARIRYQSETMICLAAILRDSVRVLLESGDECRGTERERRNFRRSVTRSLLCLHQRLEV